MNLGKSLGIASMPFVWNTALGLGSDVVGGYFDYKGAKEDIRSQEAINAQNIAYQKEFAQKGLKWRIDDARSAGINPLAALGFSGPSYQNVVAPESGAKYRSIGSTLGKMGQNLQRAAMATMTAKERYIQEKEDDLRLKEIGYKNKLLDFEMTNIGRTNNPAIPEPVPQSQLFESEERPGHFYLAPSGEAAMASQGDYFMPLTYRMRKAIEYFTPGSPNYMSTEQFPLPRKYAEKGFNIWIKDGQGMWKPGFIGSKGK